MAQITTYEITNSRGDNIAISNYGARLISWQTQVNEQSRNIVLGYQNLEDYLNDPYFIGAIVGPYANRIANAQLTINEQPFKLSANEGKNQLHSGQNAIANQFWQCENHQENSLTLSCQLPDGFNGFPGDISIKVRYEISTTSGLTITIEASSSKVSVIGPTAHPYFNLNVEQQSPVHALEIAGEHYTPVNEEGIPLGKICPVAASPFDYRTMRTIDNTAQALDNNFLIKQTDTSTEAKVFKHASLRSEDKTLTLSAYSNYPAVQVYTGKHLNTPFTSFSGICLEPQFCPDSPNQANFPFHLTSPENPLTTVITYQLAKG